MATSTELLRAAEHMRKRCLDEVRGDQVLRRAFYDAAEMLESEAKRLQAIEAHRPKTYCSDAICRYDGVEMLVEETPHAFAMRFKDNPDNSLHLGKNCNVVTSERFLLGLCREVVRPARRPA